MERDTFLRAHSWNGCTFTYSSLHALTGTAVQPQATAGIKYVLEGTEYYSMRGQNHGVREGEYLLLNENRRFGVELPYNPVAVRGFCISLSTELINDVEHCSTHSEEQLLDNPRSAAVSPTDFAELITPAGDVLGRFLGTVAKRLDAETGRVAENDQLLFTRIAEALLVSQRKLRTTVAPLAARRTITRVELYRRIERAKALMDEAPETVSSISVLAQEATLSEFHFMRCFRQLYGMSPHQYLIRRRIRKAEDLLRRSFSVSEVALRCGFPDVPSFSKAFRKHSGCAPSQFSRI